MRRQILLRALVSSALVTLSASSSFASTEAVNASTISPTLTISVTVQKAIRLTLSTGVSGTACTVSAASDYSMSFGSVDAIGITTPSCGARFNPTTPGSTPAAYYTDYQLTPMFSNQTSTTATLSAYVSTNFSALNSGILTVVQANSAPGAIGSLIAMSTNVGSQTSVGTSLASGTAITRYIGVTVAPTNSGAGAVAGADSAVVTYTMTVP